MFSIDMNSHSQFFSFVNDLAILFPVFLIVFTFRGFFQALVAKLFGDNTAQRYGFLTLNPLAHIDFSGMMITLVVLFIIGGLFAGALPRAFLLMMLILFGIRWTIPVPIDLRVLRIAGRERIGGIATTLAGSLGNFFVAALAVPLLRLILWEGMPPYVVKTFSDILVTLIDIALFFCVLDLIPLPPFSGGRALRYILPASAHDVIDWLERNSLFILLALIVLPGISDVFFGMVHFFVLFLKEILFRLFFFSF